MANYPVDPASLKPFLPVRTELDKWEGETYVSLVGFQFLDVRVRKVRVPFHTNFPEVNLRFYVRYKEDGNWKRGVVFIREIVPLPAVSLVANTLFKERYISLPMRRSEITDDTCLTVGYQWKYKQRWNELSVRTTNISKPLEEGSAEEFITEHFWGYSRTGPDKTTEYQVAHPRWDIYLVDSYQVRCDFGKLYGEAFSVLESQTPESVFLAEGSPIEVYGKKTV